MPRPTVIMPLVLDANVILDYACCESAICRAIARYIAPVLVPDLIVEGIQPSVEKQWGKRNIKIVTTSAFYIEQLFANNGNLSRADHACLWLTLKQNGILISNDNCLRQEGATQGITMMWGLEPLVLLVRRKRVSVTAAKQAVQRMQKANPLQLSDERVRGILGF